MATAARPAMLPPATAAKPREASDERVVLHGIRWEQYEALGDALEEKAGVRMAYLDGVLEIMTLSRHHEHVKTLLARLIEAFAEEREISLNGYGSETLRRKLKESGIEPDECYCVGREKRYPDIAIEVVVTSGGVDKLEVYRRLGVREVWFWIDESLRLYGLTGNRYESRRQSELLGGLAVSEIAAIVAATSRSHQTEAVRKFRRSLRRTRG